MSKPRLIENVVYIRPLSDTILRTTVFCKGGGDDGQEDILFPSIRMEGGRRKTRKAKRPPKQCHPRVSEASPNGCLPVEVLENVARKNGISGPKESLLANVSKMIGIAPHNQSSLLKALPLPQDEKRRLAREWLRPEIPASWKGDPDMWLDTLNIRDVMIQYEDVYPKFKFLGPYPIDFAAPDPYDKSQPCLISEMCELDLDGKDMKGKDYIGFVFNLDPHTKEGSHWIASFINIPKKEFYYFDSYGMRPPKQVDRFMQWLTLQEPELKLLVNGRRFQRKESECGMFCMYFIVCMLKGESFRHFCRRSPSDDLMLEMRETFYST